MTTSAASGACLKAHVAGALCALLLLGAPWPISADEAKPLTAILIVARAQITDPNFSDSVAVVMNNLGPGPVGIIINRPTQVPVSRLFPNLKGLTQVQDKVYFGGPVDFGSVWFLFRAASRPEHAVEVFEGIYLSASQELLLQLLARKNPTDGLRIFIGHAGWAPGQLEGEIKGGDWTLEHVDANAIFHQPEHPWPTAQTPKQSI
jgi:putative transcriptional regulator